jgi:phage shock protein A
MADTTLPPSEILELIKGQARLETKLDQFFSAQTAMKTEIENLKTDIGSVKTDIAEIKSQRRATKSYLAGIAAAAGVISWLAGQFLDPILKKILGA